MVLAVIIPARNAAERLPRCLKALRQSGPGVELCVVDDGSTDGTAEVAEAHGARVVRLDTTVGPAAARNAGARATSAELVLFVDADVAVAEDAIPRVIAAFAADPDLAGVFGSYDASPSGGSFVSDYRNLLHHFVHQNSSTESESFWTGCGAVRRSVFLELGGFDERYRRPSVEDIEFGSRCASAGYRIRLDKELQGKHLKRWTFAEVMRTDIGSRAYPWSRLIVERSWTPRDLNLRPAHRASAVIVWLGVLAAAATFWAPSGWRAVFLSVLVLSLGLVTWLNRDFYGWLARRRGFAFVAGAFWLHLLYYAYASATFCWTWSRHQFVRSV